MTMIDTEASPPIPTPTEVAIAAVWLAHREAIQAAGFEIRSAADYALALAQGSTRHARLLLAVEDELACLDPRALCDVHGEPDLGRDGLTLCPACEELEELADGDLGWLWAAFNVARNASVPFPELRG